MFMRWRARDAERIVWSFNQEDVLKRPAIIVALVALMSLPGAAAPPDPVQALADDAHPRICEIASGVTIATWSERADSLVSSAPSAAGAGPRWKAGDAHWEAAKAKLMTHVVTWIAELVADPRAKEIVRRKFSARMNGPQAKAMQASLRTDAAKGFPAVQDGIHLAVLFAGTHPELQIGSPQFSSAYGAWLKETGIGSGMPNQTPEHVALQDSPEGFAYATARGSAIDALVRGLEGQLQLGLHDAQTAILDEIGKDAKACASGHK